MVNLIGYAPSIRSIRVLVTDSITNAARLQASSFFVASNADGGTKRTAVAPSSIR